MTEITPLSLSIENCFLVKADDGFVLVDTGYPFEWDLLRKRLSERGVKLSEISHVILTHHHNDHSGSLQKIVRENASSQVVASYLAKGPLSEGTNELTRDSRFLNNQIKYATLLGVIPLVSWHLRRPVPPWEILYRFPPYQFRSCDTLVAGDTGLRAIGIPLDGQLLATPGHTADSISVLFDSGACLIGDAAENVPTFQLLCARYSTHLITDIDAYYTSWKKVIAAGARQIYPGHGSRFTIDKLRTNVWKHKAEELVPFLL